MILVAFFIAVLFFSILALFAFPIFSPIPYFPSNGKDKKLILTTLKLKNNQVMIDLGAGDGWVVFQAAHMAFQKKLNTKFIAVELNPILVMILMILRIFHPNRNNITVIRGDIFSIDYSPFQTSNPNFHILFYMYISPWLIDRVVKKIRAAIPHYSMVSYYYPVKNMNAYSEQKGIHSIYRYEI